MQNHPAILLELSSIEEKLYELLRILPDLAARPEAMRNRGPQLRSQFNDLDVLCQNLEEELASNLDDLDQILISIAWHGNSLPSANYPSLWASWWKAVKHYARITIQAEATKI